MRVGTLDARCMSHWIDPFGVTADPDAYVPREATERALGSLLAAVRAGRPAALLAPAGMGKTLLVRVLVQRLGGGLPTVYVPNPVLRPEELAAWVLSGLGVPARRDPQARLAERIARLAERESALVLAVDDASALPVDTARWLGDRIREHDGALRPVLAAVEGARVRPVLDALGAGLEVVRLTEPMSEPETREFVLWRLQHSDAAQATRERFDAECLRAIHRLSEGNPRRVLGAALAVLRGGAPALTEDDIARGSTPRPQAPTARAPRARPASARSGDPPDVASARGRGARPRGGTGAGATRPALVGRSAPAVSEGGGAQPSPGRARRPAPKAPRHGPVAPGPAARWRLVRAAGAAALLLAALALARSLVRQPPPAPEVAAPDRGSAEAPVPAARPVTSARAAPVFSVRISAYPWATVEVDGVYYGATPVEGVSLTAGPHTFRATMPDGRVLEQVVPIDAERRSVVFE